MKKFSKIGKRVLALFIVALLNINTYATTATQDGSAFVTKAEFDSLMKDFNSAMDVYQSSLNSKIDNAVSQYLAGMASSYKSKTTPLFISNCAGNNVTMLANNTYPYKKHTTGYNIKVMYAAILKGSGSGGSVIYGKHSYWTYSKTATNGGQRNIVEKVGSNYRFKGVTSDYGENFDMNWTYVKYDYDDGFVNGTKYLYPMVWYGTNDYIFSVSAAIWGNWRTTIQQNYTASCKQPTAIVFSPTQNTYTLHDAYSSVFSDNDDTVKVYRFVDGNLTTFIASTTFAETNSVFHNGATYGSKQSLYMQGYADYPGYFWDTCQSANASSFTGISTQLAKAIPTSAPVEKDGTKWSNILYNDVNTYSYKYQASETAAEEDKTLSNFNMVNGVPFTAALQNETLKWTYAFTNAVDGRRIYLKYGKFDGSSVSGDDVEVYDASKQTDTIEMKIKKSDMIFIKWTAGSVMDVANCGDINRTKD